jgi:hypothetical protein
MLTLRRPAILTAGLGGLCWTVKAALLAAADREVPPVEGLLFVGGLALLLVAAGLVARDVVRARGVAGVLASTGLALALVLATFLVTENAQPLVRGIASGDNLGFEQEGGVFVAGLLWLALAAAAARPLSRPPSWGRRRPA